MTTEPEVPAMSALDAEHEVSLEQGRTFIEIQKSTVALNVGEAAFRHSRAELRMTLRKCVVFACVLAGGWSIFLWVRWG